MQKTLTLLMNRMYPPSGDQKNGSFVKARVIGDYNKLYKLCVRLKQNIDKLNLVRRENKELGERQTIKVYKGWALLCCGVEVDLHTHYKEKIDDIKEQIRQEKLIQE